jgi:glycosyltransferase involved in cell wall biosynthesis
MKTILLITPPLVARSGWGRYSLAVIHELKRYPEWYACTLSESHSQAEPSDYEFSLSPWTFLKAMRKARVLAQTSTVVHALEGWPYAILGWWAVLGTKKPLFITAVGTYSVRPLRSFWKGWWLRAAYRRAARIFCISRYTEKQIRAATKLSSLSTVHLGKNVLPSASSQEIGEVQTRLGLQDFQPLVVTVGEVKNRKGQLDTLQAVILLKSLFPGIGYVMVGSARDTQYVDLIQKTAREAGMGPKVKIMEGVDDHALAALYTLADAVALNAKNDAGHFEGFGLVLVEAASFGAPVIGSREAGTEDALEDGVNGFLTAQGDPVDIAEKLSLLLTQGRQTFEEKSQTFAAQFSWEKTVSEYIRAYNQAL